MPDLIRHLCGWIEHRAWIRHDV